MTKAKQTGIRLRALCLVALLSFSLMLTACSPEPSSAETDAQTSDRETLQAKPTETLFVSRQPFEMLNGSGGGYIVFENEANADYNFELYIMNADGSAVTKLTDNPGYDGSPCFSPDLTKIAFTSTRDNSVDIYIFDLEAFLNGEQKDLLRLTDEGNNYYPAWSPDGKTIAFSSDRDGGFKLYTMNGDGSAQTRLTDLEDAAFSAWSPDGRQVAFSAKIGSTHDIFSMDKDGSNLRQLTDDPGDDLFPCWSPNGEQIAYSSSTNATSYDISIMDKNGDHKTTIISHKGLDELPKWSPDGTQIIFRSSATGSDQITLMNADGSNIQPLTKLKGKTMPYDWQSNN